jgi:hypothetical protein
MIRNSLFGLAAALMTLTAFSGTLSVLEVGTVKADASAPIA